jgi:NTP pyrophosphatase (non-canonical NTP hydrolase)
LISAKVLAEVLAEVEYAVEKHGEMKTPLNSEYPEPLRNLSILVEEVGEVSRALNDDDPENLKEELAQVAAVAMMWLQAIENGTPPPDESHDTIRDVFREAVENMPTMSFRFQPEPLNFDAELARYLNPEVMDRIEKTGIVTADDIPKTAAELGDMSIRASLRDAGYEEVGTMGGTPVWVPPEPEEPTEAERAFTTAKLPDDFYETGGGEHDPKNCSVCKVYGPPTPAPTPIVCQLGGEQCKTPESCFCDDYGVCWPCAGLRCDLPDGPEECPGDDDSDEDW